MLKPNRIKNKALLKSFYSKKCTACPKIGSDPAHIKTVGSGGNDTEENLIPLCREHHSEQHSIGIATFALKYSTVEDYLNRHGWEIINVFGVNRIRRQLGK